MDTITPRDLKNSDSQRKFDFNEGLFRWKNAYTQYFALYMTLKYIGFLVISLVLIDSGTWFWCHLYQNWGRGIQWSHLEQCRTNRVARFVNQGCQFHIFGYISGSNRLRDMILVSFIPKLRSRNPMKPFRTVYIQQGCQICLPGLPVSHFWLYLWF